MATRPDTEWNEPLQPGRTEPEPTTFPDPNPLPGGRPVDPNPLAPEPD